MGPAKYAHAVQLAFAHSTQTVFHIMAGVLAVTFVVAIRFLRRAQEPAAAAYDAPDSGSPSSSAELAGGQLSRRHA